jgi:adenylate kinase
MLFVAGIHAVGKTFLLRPTCESLGIRHATASQLIKEQRGMASWGNSRQVDDIDENQQALISAVARLEKQKVEIVLDGHFVLRRSVNSHEKISPDIFSRLMITGVVLIEAPAAIVLERLLQRGDATWSVDEIALFAQKELEHAKYVSDHLRVPFVSLNMPSSSTFEATLKEMLVR